MSSWLSLAKARGSKPIYAGVKRLTPGVAAKLTAHVVFLDSHRGSSLTSHVLA